MMRSKKRLAALICFLLMTASWAQAAAQEVKAPASREAGALPSSTQEERIDKLEAASRQAEQALSQGKAKRAQEHAQRALKLWGFIESSQLPAGAVRDRACHAATSATFTVAELERERVTQIKLLPKSLNEDIKRKVSAMQRAQAGYMKALSLGQQCKQTLWVAASTVRTGELFERLAQDLEDAPLPPDLKGEEQEAVYRATLRDFSSPLLQKARESYEAAQKLPSSGDATIIKWQSIATQRLSHLGALPSKPGEP